MTERRYFKAYVRHIAILGAAVALGAADIPVDPPSQLLIADGCLDAHRADDDMVGLIRDAIKLVERTGHEPSRYRLELRSEDGLQPDASVLNAERLDSVIFVPREPDELYPMRVNRMNPCVVGWVLRPFAPTDWQRRVIERATAIVLEADPADPIREVVDVQVLESARLVGIRIRREDGESISVTLRKSDLTALEP